MKILMLLAGVATVAITCSSPAIAGGGSLFRHRPLHAAADCGCAQPMPTCAAPSCAAPVRHAGLFMAEDCHCVRAAGLSGPYFDGAYGGAGILTGYEGLPNMDGGGVHARYPYHSYRRPWAHPGPASTNITIVW